MKLDSFHDWQARHYIMFFIMKQVFLIHLMLFWIGLTTDEQISHADLFQEWFDHKAYFFSLFFELC